MATSREAALMDRTRRRVLQRKHASRWAAAGGILAALGICSACWLLPVVLISVGVTGAWVSTLDSLSAYKWHFVFATVALLGYGFVLAYPRKAACGDARCDGCRPSRTVRVALWVGMLFALAGLLFERYEPLLLG